MELTLYKIENPKKVFVGTSWPYYAGVYAGSLDRLRLIDDLLDWKDDKDIPYLSLADISKQRGGEERLITVITNGPLNGQIYQWGNYGDEWWVIGAHKGYA